MKDSCIKHTVSKMMSLYPLKQQQQQQC